MSTEDPDFFAALAQKGEQLVRLELATGIYTELRAKLAQEWLRRQVELEAERTQRRQHDREEESLAVAREALEAAHSANRISAENAAAANSSADSARNQARWAKWAAIVAAVAAIVSAKDDLLKFVRWLN